MNPMNFQETGIPGLKTFKVLSFLDERGSFNKPFHAPSFEKEGFSAVLREECFSISKKNVLRGMHFQTPPAAHMKLVTCLGGKVLDVAVDIRKGSPAFGMHFAIELSAENRMGLAIPAGFAHGFLALTDNALVHYLTSWEHVPANDAGIRWDSFGMKWPAENMIISDKDRNLPSLAEFITPFSF